MADTPFPLPRATRQTAVLEGDGTTTVFGPFSFKIFDIEDVEVQARLDGETFFSTVAATIAKTSGDAFADFTVTFAAAPAATTEFLVLGRREPMRQLAVTKGGSIAGTELEKELSKQATALSEMRRDLDRAMVADVGETGRKVAALPEGHFPMADEDGNLVDGGSSASITEAAAAAAASAAAAAASATSAGNSATSAAGSATAADGSADAAAASATSAAGSATAAAGSATAAAGSATAAATSATNAGNSATAAAGSAADAIAAASSVQAIRDSRADAISNFHPIAAPNFILTSGYAAAGDGGGALYKKAVAEPSHAGKLSITLAGATTAWYEIVPDQEGLNPLALGVVMGATIDVNDVASLTNYANTGALAAATIGGSVEAVKVDGVPWRRIDAAHPRLGPELLANGNFSNPASFVESGDTAVWNVAAGIATSVAGGAAFLLQSEALANGDKVFVQFEVLSVTAGGVRSVFGGSNTLGAVHSTTGIKSDVLTATAASSSIGLYSNGFSGTCDNISARKLPTDAVQSADGAWWAVCDLRYAPIGTGAVTGTDSLAAVVAAQAVSEALKVPILWPSGDIRILIPDGSQQILVSYGEWGLHWKSAGRTRFILDDNPAYTAVGQSGNNFIGSAKLNETSLFSRNVSQRAILEQGIVIQGTWWRDIEKGGRSWTGALPYRCHAFAPTNTGTVRVEGAEIIDIMGFAMRTRSCGQVIYTKNRLTRIAGDGYRAEDCHNVQIFGNYGLHVDDNIVAVPDWDDISNEAGPRRAGISVTGNVFESCRGMLVLGPAATDISHNVLRRMYSHGITAFAQTADVSDRGEGGFRTTTISHNIIEDTLKESAIANPPDGTWSTDVFGISIQGGAPTSPTGTGTGTPATLPYASTTQAWGAMHAQDIAGSDAVAGFRGAALQCNNNTIMRTHQGGSTYSCMGYGRRFTRWGFDNPAIGDTEFAKSGIQLRGDFYGARVVGNIIQNFPLGAGIYLGRASTNMAFRRVLISMNQIANVLYGIDCDAGSAKYQNIAIVMNDIDVDPYRIQSARAAGNKWTAGFNADAPCCIHLTFLRGLYVAFNHFRNAANPWSLEGGAVEAIQYNTLRGNIGYVGIETGTAASSTDADNVGLGRIPRSGDMMTYRIQDLDPASATFEQDQAGMLTYSAAMPASGHYVFGHKVDTDAGIYLRLTTGTAHVLNTDWKLM